MNVLLKSNKPEEGKKKHLYLHIAEGKARARLDVERKGGATLTTLKQLVVYYPSLSGSND